MADELDTLMDDMTGFINRKTGEIVSISHDEASLADEEVEEDDLPEWQAEMLPMFREVLYGEDWVTLPTKFDVHGWRSCGNLLMARMTS